MIGVKTPCPLLPHFLQPHINFMGTRHRPDAGFFFCGFVRRGGLSGLPPVPAGGHAAVSAELAAEVFCTAVAAQQRDLGNALIGVGKIFPGHAQAAADHILHAGDAELFFV